MYKYTTKHIVKLDDLLPDVQKLLAITDKLALEKAEHVVVPAVACSAGVSSASTSVPSVVAPLQHEQLPVLQPLPQSESTLVAALDNEELPLQQQFTASEPSLVPPLHDQQSQLLQHLAPAPGFTFHTTPLPLPSFTTIEPLLVASSHDLQSPLVQTLTNNQSTVDKPPTSVETVLPSSSLTRVSLLTGSTQPRVKFDVMSCFRPLPQPPTLITSTPVSGVPPLISSIADAVSTPSINTINQPPPHQLPLPSESDQTKLSEPEEGRVQELLNSFAKMTSGASGSTSHTVKPEAQATDHQVHASPPQNATPESVAKGIVAQLLSTIVKSPDKKDTITPPPPHQMPLHSESDQTQLSTAMKGVASGTTPHTINPEAHATDHQLHVPSPLQPATTAPATILIKPGRKPVQ